MGDNLIEILTSYYFWIVIEAIIIVILLYFIVKYSRLNKALKKEKEIRSWQNQYRELDNMLVNNRRKK